MADQAEFKFESKEWDALLKRLKTKWKDIKNRDTFADIVAIASFRDIIEHFDDQSGPDGPWTARSPKYKKYIEAKGYTNILQVTGNLRKSLMFGTGKVRKNSSGVILYTPVKYAKKHDEGLDGMPKRKFMWLSKKAIDSILMQTLKWLDEE